MFGPDAVIALRRQNRVLLRECTQRPASAWRRASAAAIITRHTAGRTRDEARGGSQ